MPVSATGPAWADDPALEPGAPLTPVRPPLERDEAPPANPSFLRRLTGIVSGVLSFSYLIFVLNPIQVASVVLYPFSHRLFREVNRWCARSVWGLWALTAEVQNKIQVRFFGDRITPRENALLIPNHQTMADVMVLLSFAWRAGRLGDLKWFVKDVIKYFPGFGWGMRFLDCIFVKRDWAQDQGNVERLFAKYKAKQIPVFLVSFLEGTRRTPEKLAKARAFAAAEGLYVPGHTLVPRTKGFLATLGGLRDHLDAVYDITIGYPGPVPPTLVNCFECRVSRVDVHVRRFPIAELPTTEEELKAWVFERFREKDALMAEYAETQRFPGEWAAPPVRLVDWLRSEKKRIA